MIEMAVGFLMGAGAVALGVRLGRVEKRNTSESDVIPAQYFEGIGSRPSTLEEIEQKERANKSSAYYTTS